MDKEKKEIWMEKLIELLLECKPQVHYLDKPKGVYDKKYGIGWYKREWDFGWWFSEEVIISKKFWFIKWLVENDKIDLWEKLFNLTKNDNRKSIICDLDNNDFSWEDTFLMLLSISSSPIDDLISYLK